MSCSSNELAVSLGSVITASLAPRVGRPSATPRWARIARPVPCPGQAVGTAVDGIPRTRAAPFTPSGRLATAANATRRLIMAAAFILRCVIARFNVVASRR